MRSARLPRWANVWSAVFVSAIVTSVVAAPTSTAQVAVPLAPSLAPAGDGAEFVGKLAPGLRSVQGTATVFVELAKKSALDAFTEEQARGGGKARAKRLAKAANQDVNTAATDVVATLTRGDAGAKLLAVTTNGIPGAIVSADIAMVRELSSRRDVVAIRPVAEHEKSSTNSVQTTGALAAWQRTGHFGDGVRIGIIDDGIDYTHAAFGGSGTKDAYSAIDSTKVDASYFPTAKVVGGTDLVGNNYDASGAAGSPIPVPDPNPISCGHHGTHGSSIIASQGVNADGSTFTGDYAKLTGETVNTMRVGPGMAPRALLYSIKVFGCEGLTSSLTPKALDWALDPDGDGDSTDKLDIVSLALSSNYNAVDDPTALFVRKLARHDVLAVFSAGNGTDLYDVAGSPGSLAPEALTVASTRDTYFLRDALRVTTPAAQAGIRTGQFSLAYASMDSLDLNRPVVPLSAANAKGCAAYSPADAAAVAGKFAWLEFDDQAALDGQECGSVARANIAQAAGAAGVVLTGTMDHFVARITGNKTMPMFQLTATTTEALRPVLAGGPLHVTLRGSDRASVPTYDDALSDTASIFTSRGVRGPVVKPDIAAPGDTIAAAFSGSGTDRAVFSGTSMSAPHATGITALIRQAHPDWTYEEVKAGAMNTARHDVTDGKGKIFAPQRVGAGRIDADAALTTKVLAYVKGDPGVVSASFGVVAAGEPLALTKTIKVVNKGVTPAEFDVAYQGIVEAPGVRYEVSPNRVRVGARGVATVEVSLRIDDPAALRKAMDPTMEAIQSARARQFVADASGRVVLTPRSGATVPLRVPVAASPKPVSAMSVPGQVRFRGTGQQTVLNLSGRGLDQGAGALAYRSLVSLFELHGESPKLPGCTVTLVTECAVNDTARGGDLRYVGAMTTAPLARAQGKPETALLAFGMATWGDWANIGSNTIPFVRIDTTGDGMADFESSVTKARGTDVLLINTVDLRKPVPGGFTSVDVQPVNGRFGDTDTNVFDTNVVVLPVRLAALGVDPAAASHPITYTAGVTGFYKTPGSTAIDRFDTPMAFDVLAPNYWVQGGGDPALTYLARPGTALVVSRTTAATPPSKLLALFHHNAAGSRTKLVKVKIAGQRGGASV